MIHQFEITCKECGAEGFFDPDNNGVVKMLFEKGTPATMDRVIIYCSKCGGKQEAGIYWPLDTNAVLTKKSSGQEKGR
jgi:RNase P subunit RPR2